MSKQTIFITGGSGKIGGQLVNHFLGEGWRVAYTSRGEDSRERLAKRFGWASDPGGKLVTVVSDFNEPDAVENVFAQLAAANFRMNVLVNNARSLDSLKVTPEGLSLRQGLMDEYLIDVVIPYELATGAITHHGHPLDRIINVSSIYGLVPFNPALYDNFEQSAPIQYSLAKAAVNHLTRELAIRLRGKVRVNTVTYGGVAGRVDDGFKARYAALCPDGEMLTEEQTIGPVAFLAAESSRGITGQNIVQDGGWTVW